MIRHVEYLECSLDGVALLCVLITEPGEWHVYDAVTFRAGWEWSHWVAHGCQTDQHYSWQYKTVRYRDAREPGAVGAAVHPM